jgi:HlyD family secretion protein
MNVAKFWAVLLLSASFLGACARDEDEMVGTLERDRIELRVETNEPIIAVRVADGTRVTEGTVILQQDPLRSQARLHQMQARRDQAAARLAELRRGPREEAIREAQAALQASAVLTRNAQAEFERAREIFERGLSNQSALDQAQTLWETAMARERGERESLAALLSGTTVEELQQAQAALAAAEALVDQGRIDLDRLTLIAPGAGVIDKVLYQRGERPAPGTTVAVLLDERRSFARIYVPEHLRTRVGTGQSMKISVDGVASAFDGTVRWVSADASFTPYFALTEHDRSRLSYLAEVDLDGAERLPAGVPLVARIAPAASQ